MKTTQRLVDFDDPTFDPFKTIDQFQGVFEIDDPYPRIHALHRQGTVIEGDLRQEFGLDPFPMWSDYPSYMVFGYDAVMRVFNDDEGFSSTIWQEFFLESFGESITGMDGPIHRKYRRLFQQAFLPQTVARWGNALMPRVINGIIDSFANRGHAELISEFTSVYPFKIIYDQLALPAGDRELFHKLAVGTTCLAVDYEHAVEASKKLGDYFLALLTERRSAIDQGVPLAEDDIISLLAVAEVEGQRLPDHITVAFLRQLFAAAGDNTYRNSSALMVALMTHPDQFEAIRQDRSLVKKAVDESLRWEVPIMAGTRQTTRELEIDGVTIPAGAKIDVVQGSANRDPSRYENPDEFNIFRKMEHHTSFGSGPHVCIGQYLAKMELAQAVNCLLDRLPNLRLNPSKPVPRVVGLSSRTSTEVHVLFD